MRVCAIMQQLPYNRPHTLHLMLFLRWRLQDFWFTIGTNIPAKLAALQQKAQHGWRQLSFVHFLHQNDKLAGWLGSRSFFKWLVQPSFESYMSIHNVSSTLKFVHMLLFQRYAGGAEQLPPNG